MSNLLEIIGHEADRGCFIIELYRKDLPCDAQSCIDSLFELIFGFAVPEIAKSEIVYLTGSKRNRYKWFEYNDDNYNKVVRLLKNKKLQGFQWSHINKSDTKQYCSIGIDVATNPVLHVHFSAITLKKSPYIPFEKFEIIAKTCWQKLNPGYGFAHFLCNNDDWEFTDSVNSGYPAGEPIISMTSSWRTSMMPSYADSKVFGAFWLNFISSGHLAQLGGQQEFEEKLKDNCFAYESFGSSLMFKIGDTPNYELIEANLEQYARAKKLLEPIILPVRRGRRESEIRILPIP